MSLSALDSVDDAIEATKRFLLPFDRARWFRLAVIMLFVAGAGVSFPNVPTGFGGGPDVGSPGPGPGPDPGPGPAPGSPDLELTGTLLALIVGLFVLVVALVLLWAVAGAVMEFVFVESLRTEHVRLWTYFKSNLRRGARLFVFRAVIWLVTVGLVAAVVGGLFFLALGGSTPTAPNSAVIALLGLLAVAIPVLLLAVAVVGTFLGFTNMFVVPVMLVEERGVISAWRRFWGTLTADWKEYLVYLVVSILLGIGVGIASGFLTLIVVLVLAIPFAVAGLPLLFAFDANAIVGSVLLVLGLVYALLVFVSLLLIKVPFQTFLRYYALLVLGDTNPEFDVVPDARRAVRTDGSGDGPAGGPTGGGPGGPGGPDSGAGGPGTGAPGRGTGRDGRQMGGSGGGAGPGTDAAGDPEDATDDGWNVDRDER